MKDKGDKNDKYHYQESITTSNKNDNDNTSITRYAKFTATPYNISYNETYGVLHSNPLTYTIETNTITFTDPTSQRTGYTFKEWNPASIDKGSTGDKIITAQWTANKYTITLNGNVGSAGSATATYDGGWSGITHCSRTGYTLNGYYTAPSDGDKVADAFGDLQPNVSGYTDANGKWKKDDNATLYAQWTINIYTITYQETYGVSHTNPSTYTIETPTITFANPTTQRPGYDFVKWEPASIAKGSVGNATITAQWTARTDTKYTIEHYFQDINGNYPAEPTQTQVLYGTTDTQVTPDYWSDYTGYTLPAKQTVNIDGDGSRVVQYKYTINSYTLTWVGNDGTVNNKEQEVQTVKYSSPLSSYKPLDANVKRNGYDFVGWDPAVAQTMPAHDLTYTAQWEAKGQDISFVANQSTGSNPSPIQGKVGQPYGTLPQPGSTTFDKSGYSFDGWFTAASGGTKVESTSLVEAGITTLYAHWTPKTYTVTFHPGEGGTVSPISTEVTFDAAYGTLPTPVRNGYVFGGWWTDATGGTEITATTTFNIAGNVDRYAHWTALTVDNNTTPAALTFTEPGGQTVTVNFTVSGGTLNDFDPTVAGSGWSFVSSSISGTTISVVAKFTAISTTPTVNAGTVTLTSKAVTQSSRTVNVSANVTLTPSLTANPNPLDFGTVVRGSGATTRTIAILGTNVVEWSFAELSAPWSVVKKDNAIEVTFNPQSETAVGAIEKTFDITYKNAQAPVTEKTLNVTLKANVTLSEATTEWRGGEEFYVESADLNINDNSVWYSQNTSTRSFEITNWTPTGSNNAGAHQPAITADNKLSLGQAGTLTLIMHQPADASYNAVDIEQNIEIKKRENAISHNWNPNHKDLITGKSAAITLSATNTDYVNSPFSVTTTATDVAKYENGTVYALGKTGDAYFTVTQPENYKYQSATAGNIFYVTVKRNGEASCDLLVNESSWGQGDNNENAKSWTAEDVAGTLTFKVSSDWGTKDQTIQVYEKIGSAWSPIGGVLTIRTPLGSGGTKTFTQQLSRKATAVSIHNVNGTASRTYGQVTVTRVQYLEADNVTMDAVDYGNSQTDYVPVRWNCGNGGNLKVECSDDQFTVTPTEIPIEDCHSGNTTLKVVYKGNQPGAHTANVQIFNSVYSTTATVTGTTRKRTPTVTWTPDDESFNVGDQLTAEVPDGAVVGLSVPTDDEQYVSISGTTAYITDKPSDNHKITITVTITENTIFVGKTFTKQISITNLTKQFIDWEQQLKFKTTETGDLVLNGTSKDGNGNPTGLPVSYAFESDSHPGLTLTQNGNQWTLTHSNEECSTFIIASQAGDGVEYAPAKNVILPVKIIDPEASCDLEETLINSSIELENDDQKFAVETPKEIKIHVERNSGIATFQASFTISLFSGDNGTGTQLFTTTYSYTAINDSKDITLTDMPVAAKSLVLSSSSARSYFGYNVTSCTYSKHQYCTPNVTELDAISVSPNQTTTQGGLKIKHANYPLELQCANNKFSFSPSEFGGCGEADEVAITVSYAAGSEIGTDEGIINVVDNAGLTRATIKVPVVIAKQMQEIEETNVKTSYLTTEQQELVSRASSNLTEFTYEFYPTNSGIAQVNNNILTFLKSGVLDSIRVIQPGNDRFNPATKVIKNVTVTAVDPTLSVNSLSLNYLDVLNNSQLSGCAATTTLRGVANTPVEGTFTWGSANPAGTIIEDPAGTKSLAVTFTPNDNGMYNSVTKYFTINITRIDPAFTMSDGTIDVTVDESHPTTIDLTSLIATLPEKNPMNKSEFTFKNGDQTIDKMFYATAAGEYNLTATSPQTNYYNPASQNFKVTVNKLTPTISGSDVTGKLVEDVFTADYTFVNVSGTPSSSSTDDFYYTIDKDVVSYDPANNQITCLKEGTATITFTQKETTQFTAATKSFTITVSKKTTTFNPSWDATQTHTIQVGQSVSVNVVNVENDWGTDFAYTVTPAGVFEVTRSANTITFTAKKACDNASVQLKQNATVRYTGLDKTYNFVVTRIPNTLEVASTAKTLYVCDTWTNIVSGKNSNAALQVITDPTPTDIISYDDQANSIAAHDEGSVKITFKQEATDEYEGATKSIDIKVLRHQIKLTSSLSGTVTNGQTLSQTILTGTRSATTVPTEYTPSKDEPIEGTWDWATPEETISETTATIQRDYVFTPANPCFQTNSVQVTIAINKATPVIMGYPTGTLVMTAEETLNNGVNTASIPNQCWAVANGVKIPGIVAWVDGDAPKLMEDKFGYLSFTPTDKLTYNDAEQVSVSIQVNSIPRSITWNQEGLNQIPADKPFTMTAEASGITSEVKYEIVEDAQSIATITGDQISFSCHGTVKVMATTIPNPNYSQDTTYQNLTAIVVEPELNVTASAITYGATVGSSTLQLGANDPAGTLSWKPEDASKMPDAGTYNYIVSYTPASESQCIYKETTASVTLTVNKAASTINWLSGLKATLYAGEETTAYKDSVELTEGLPMEFRVTSGDAYLKVDGTDKTKLIALNEGTATVVAYTPGDENHNEATSAPQTFTIKPAQDPVFIPSWEDNPHSMYIDQTETITIANVSPAGDENFTYTVTPADAMQLTREGNVITLKAAKAYNEVTVTLEQKATLTYHAKKQSYSFTIITRETRTIIWEQDLSNIPANGSFALTATVDKGDASDIVYAVQTIPESTGNATIDGHNLIPTCSGKIKVKASLKSNPLYFDTTPIEKEATIVLAEPTLNNVAATPIDVLQPLSESQLSYEGTEGSLVWTDGTVVPPYPGGNYSAHFTPAVPCQYQEKDVDVHVTVNKLIPTITWTCETEYQTDQDSIPLCFVVTSPTGEVLNDIELTYASENEDIATIVKNHAGQWVLHVKSTGNVTITATSTETDIYASEKGSADIHYQKMPDEIVWNGGEPIPSFEANAYIPHGIAQSKNDPNDPNMKVTYTSDNTSVIMIGDDGIIHTVNSGKANLTARTSGNAKFEPAESTMEITVSKRQLQLVWEQVFLNFDESYINTTIELVASVIDPSSEVVKDYPITFSFVATDGNPATITGTTLSIIGYGKGTITAHVTVPTEDKDIYDDIEESKSLRVRQTGEKCNTNILFKESITLNPSHETFILPYYAPGGKVTLRMRRGLILGSSNDRHLRISVSEEPSTEHVNQLADYLYKDIPTSWTDFEYDCSQYPNARYLIFECPLADLSDKEIYIQNISVTQNSYISSPTESIDRLAFARQHWTDTIILNYSDVSAIQYEMLHSDESEITIEPVEGTEIDNDCGDFGTYKFVLKANWQQPYMDGLKDTIYFSSLTGEKLRIPVKVIVQATAPYKFTNGEGGDGDGKWSTSTNWSYDDYYTHGSIPHEYDKVSIDAPVLIDKEVAVNQISIYQDVTIAPNAGLTVWEGGVAGSGKVILQASIDPETIGQAYFRRSPKIQTQFYDNMPNAIVQLATRSTLNTGANKDATWQYFGIPVESLPFRADYITWLYEWNEPKGWQLIGNNMQSDATLTAWTGYAITQYGQPTYEFSGRLLNNDQTITLTKTETGMAGDNLFANSYASPIDVKRFTEDDFEGDLDKTFYIFNSGSWNQWDTYKEQIKREQGQTLIAAPGQYIAIPALTAKGLDESYDQTMIAPMQGVYVYANEDGAKIKLNYEKHVWNAKPRDPRYSQMNNPARAPKADTIAVDTTAVDSIDLFTLNRRVRMVAYGENSGADFIYVMEHNDYTRHYDNGCDGPKIFADAEGVLSLYTNEENTGLMSVAATNNVDSMFIGFNAGEDVNYELYITSVIGDDLELMDMQTGDRFALRDSASYEFAATPNSEDPYRFRIFKSETKPVVPTGWNGLGQKAKIWYNKQTIYISDAAANSTAEIFTAAGDLLMTTTFNHNTTISTEDMPVGVYTIRVEDSVLKFFVK